jgi:hypothetical protein
MPDGIGNGPQLTEITRRLLRVELLLDERIVTKDMLAASERLFDAKEIAQTAVVDAQDRRINKLEASNAALTRLVIGAFLALLVQAIVLIFTLASKGG